jgi:CRP-like cAMP-binding protein
LSKLPRRVSLHSRARKRIALPSLNRPPPGAVRNRLLAALPASDRERLLPTLAVIPLTLKTLLHKPGDAIQHVYFPGGGFLSLVTVLENGRMVEAATVGREGMVGLAATLKGIPVPSATMVQGETDTCYRMPAEAFRREMDRRGAFYVLMTFYSQAVVAASMQATACNAVHSVEQRLARWLLLAHDRMASDEFPLTQEFAAMMLGTSRQTVTIVAGILQSAGLITYRRGKVTVLDRPQLEQASCECYQAATALFEAVIEGAPRPS